MADLKKEVSFDLFISDDRNLGGAENGLATMARPSLLDLAERAGVFAPDSEADGFAGVDPIL